MLNKTSVLSGLIGLVLSFLSQLIWEALLFLGIILMLVSVFSYAVNRANGWLAGLVLIYMALILACFLALSWFVLLGWNYLFGAVVVAPLVFYLTGLLIKSGDIKERLFASFPYLVCLLCITFVHFMLIALMSTGV